MVFHQHISSFRLLPNMQQTAIKKAMISSFHSWTSGIESKQHELIVGKTSVIWYQTTLISLSLCVVVLDAGETRNCRIVAFGFK